MIISLCTYCVSRNTQMCMFKKQQQMVDETVHFRLPFRPFNHVKENSKLLHGTSEKKANLGDLYTYATVLSM